MRKGMELPINVLIIIVIAVVVLITVIVLLGNVPNMGCDAAKSSACLKLVQDCSTDPADIKVGNFSQNGVLVTNLQQVCNQCYGKPSATECKKFCGCTVP